MTYRSIDHGGTASDTADASSLLPIRHDPSRRLSGSGSAAIRSAMDDPRHFTDDCEAFKL